jgi:type IV secretory pathway VirB2 component (pilin)
VIPESGGDAAAAVVAILGIAVLGLSAAFSVSTSESWRLRGRLIAAPGISLGTILLIWALEQGIGFVRL